VQSSTFSRPTEEPVFHFLEHACKPKSQCRLLPPCSIGQDSILCKKLRLVISGSASASGLEMQ
jgi:hypothetical protein